MRADKAIDGGGDTWRRRPLRDVGLDDQVKGIALAIVIDGRGSSAVLYTPPPFLAESARTPSNPRTVQGQSEESERTPSKVLIIRM